MRVNGVLLPRIVLGKHVYLFYPKHSPFALTGIVTLEALSCTPKLQKMVATEFFLLVIPASVLTLMSICPSVDRGGDSTWNIPCKGL